MVLSSKYANLRGPNVSKYNLTVSGSTMNFSSTTIIALLLYVLAISAMVTPVVSNKQWVEFELPRFSSGQESALSAPLDWRALVSDEKMPTIKFGQ